MRLSDLFSQNTQNVSSGNTTSVTPTDPYQQYRLNQEIRSLKPGQTLQGEVISKNGNEVQIRLHDDLVLTARLDKNMEMEPGKVVTFEVKSQGSGTLALSPLFENMGTDANVLKALDMAGLPVNRATVQMTEAMMQEGMSINKNSLQSMFKEVMNFPESSPTSIVALQKLGIEITPENLQQLENYKNLEHQIVKDMANILDEIPFQYESMMQAGDTQGAFELYEAVLKLVTDGELTSNIGTDGTVVENQPGEQTVMTESMSAETLQGDASRVLGETLSKNTETLMEMIEQLPTEGTEQAAKPGETVLPDGQIVTADKATGSTASLELPLVAILGKEDTTALLQQLESLGVKPETLQAIQSGEFTGQEVLNEIAKLIEQLPPETKESAAHAIFANKGFQNLVKQAMNQQWMIAPDEVQDKGKVDALYERLHTQLSKLSEALSKQGTLDNPLAKSVTNLQNNLDFMNQLNQVYTYVQLPLKMSEGKAHGDLYVYTNKKSLASKDGSISALLHLDMEHLGPVDVYVAMQEAKVNTHFYLPDEEMLTFIEKHLYLLDERMAQKGYVMNTKASIRNEEKNVVEEMLDAGKPVTKLSQYSFDVRA